MSDRLCVIALLAGLGVAVGSSVALAGTPGAPIKVRYDAPRDAKLAAYAELLRTNRMLETVASSLNQRFRLPAELTLVATECGSAHALYDHERRNVTICYDDVARYSALPSDEEAVIGAAGFTLYHGVGHALIHLLDLKVAGPEEDSADQLATVLLIQQEEDDRVATEVVLDGGLDTANQHSLDERRLDNIACWIHGSDPKAFAALARDGALPAERAARCPGEWMQASNGWSERLAPYRVAAPQ